MGKWPIAYTYHFIGYQPTAAGLPKRWKTSLVGSIYLPPFWFLYCNGASANSSHPLCNASQRRKSIPACFTSKIGDRVDDFVPLRAVAPTTPIQRVKTSKENTQG